MGRRGHGTIMEQTIELINDGTTNVDTLSETDLIDILRYASDRYYNTQETIMPDLLYDSLRDKLTELNAANPYLSEVGAPVKKNKVKLPFPMFSLQKVKPGNKTLASWQRKFDAPYTVSDKLDGTSAMLVWTKRGSNWKNANLVMLSRGNGIVGSDLTRLIDFVLPRACRDPPKDLQKHTTTTIAIRGELIISKAEFESFRQDGWVNARSLTNGIANKRTVQPDYASKTNFVAYEIIVPRLAKSVQMEILKRSGIPTVWNATGQSLDESDLIDLLKARVQNGLFDVDGLVIESDGPHEPPPDKNPEYAFAFKANPSDMGKITRVVDVIWETSAHGRIVPKVKYEPVVINGVTLTYASGKNARNIVENGLGPGAVIEVIHSGCVIPEIVRVLDRAEPSLPDVSFEWTRSRADIVLKDRTTDPTYQIKSIVRFFRIIGVDGIREGLVKKFFDYGFTSVDRYLEADVHNFMGLPGVQATSAGNFVEAIQSGIKNIDMAKFMMASNAFGTGIGEKKLMALLNIVPNLLGEKPDHKLQKKIADLPGFDVATAEKIVRGITTCKAFLASHPQITIKKLTSELPREGPLKGSNYVFTGFRDRALTEKIVSLGGNVTDSVSNRTTAVIYKTEEKGTKCDKAKSLRIPILPIDVFVANLP